MPAKKFTIPQRGQASQTNNAPGAPVRPKPPERRVFHDDDTLFWGFANTHAEEPQAVQIFRLIDQIIVWHANGRTLTEIGRVIGIAPILINAYISQSPELRERWAQAQRFLAETMVDEAAICARGAQRMGDYKKAGDLFLSVAAKRAPTVFGDSKTVTLQGGDKPVQTEVTHLSPTEAYKAMLGD